MKMNEMVMVDERQVSNVTNQYCTSIDFHKYILAKGLSKVNVVSVISCAGEYTSNLFSREAIQDFLRDNSKLEPNKSWFVLFDKNITFNVNGCQKKIS